MSQNSGLVRLSITPKKLELREKVTMALAKPPVHTPISKMPVSPLKTPNKAFRENNSEINLFNVNYELKNKTSAKENWNDVSF